MKFYKRDPDRALAGMTELTLEERGAYNTIIDALYSRDGILPDDDEVLRRLMGCHGSKWKAIKSRLIAHGKVWIEDGYLKAKGVDSVLQEAENFSETQRKRVGKRWEIERKRSRNASETAEKRSGKTEKAEQNQRPEDTKRADTNTPTPIDTDRKNPPCSPPTESDDCAKAVEMWNEMAEARGLPRVERVTAARAAKLRARLADAGGLDGWASALAKIRDGPEWMHGGGERGWRANFDFLLQESSFTKLMEGTYAGSATPRPNRRNGGRRTPTEQASPFVARYVAAMDAGQSEGHGHSRGGEPAGGEGGDGPPGREDATCFGGGDQPIALHLVGGSAYLRR